MARVKTFTNGGSLLPSDLDSVQDDYECAFGTYRSLLDVGDVIPGSTVAAIALLGVTDDTGGLVYYWYLDPARFSTAAATWATNPRTVYYSIEAWSATNAIAPNVTFTFGLIAMTNTGGAVVPTGGLITGSSAVITTPAASSLVHATSVDFAAPSAGFYAVQVSWSATTVASSNTRLGARLSLRQV